MEKSITFDTSDVTFTRDITADGSKALSDEAKLYDGFGIISANNSSRLLMDYKYECPETYQKLLEYMFGKDGLRLPLIKIEMGADVDSSSGTEPAVMRSADEPADVTRGAGYMLAADALKINPNLKADLLYWGIPNWVNNADDVNAAMYKWYKSTIDALYDKYGIKVTHLTVNQNERNIDTEQVKYLSKRLKENPIQDFYDTFSRNCSNLCRKFGDNLSARKRFDDEFRKIRTEALAIKKGLSENSPNSEIYAFSEFLVAKENELRELADKLVK